MDWSAIEALTIADAIRRSIWAYPVLEAIHIVAFAALFGSLLTLELRVFGAQPTIPPVALARLAVRVALVAFVIALTAGALMFISAAAEIAANPAFRVKLVLILIAGANAALFHVRDSLRRVDSIARLQAGLSMVLWFSVIVAGRMIAYI